jgi:hypothetical protein
MNAARSSLGVEIRRAGKCTPYGVWPPPPTTASPPTLASLTAGVASAATERQVPPSHAESQSRASDSHGASSVP